ncbi:MAG: phosphotransferase [Pseudomonadales bacterium]
MARVETTKLTDWICDLMPNWAPLEIGGFQYLEGGYNNQNYRFRYKGRQFVLRVPTADCGFTHRRLEVEFYRQSFALGAPLTPTVCGYCEVSGRMITEWVSGHLLADLSVDCEHLALMLRQLHAALERLPVQTEPAPVRRYDPVKYARDALANTAAPGWLKALAEAMTWDPPRWMLCHNDLNPWNLIRDSENRWVTLDWEWLAANDPMFDLVALHQGAGLAGAPSSNIGSLREFAESYADEPVSEARLRACRSAYWLRETAWAAAALARGESRAEIKVQYQLGLEWLSLLER